MQDQALPAHCVSMHVTAFEDLSGDHASIYLLGEAVHKRALLLQVCTVLSTVDTSHGSRALKVITARAGRDLLIYVHHHV